MGVHGTATTYGVMLRVIIHYLCYAGGVFRGGDIGTCPLWAPKAPYHPGRRPRWVEGAGGAFVPWGRGRR